MKKDAIATPNFYKVLVTENTDEATILLYSYIGETYEYNEDLGRWQMDGVTDIAFIQELSRLAEKYSTIHIRLNSPGGDFFHGNAIMTAIQSCKAEVHTWNDGIVASMAADIWLCGKVRHMAKNALVMIHPVWNICAGHAQDMRDSADALEKMTDAAIIATAASTGIAEDEMRARYYADYKDHWLTYADAVKDGLVTDTADEYEAADLPKAIEDMTYKQMVDHFQKRSNPDAPGLLDQLQDLYNKTLEMISRKATKAIATPSTPTNKKDMNLEQFKKALDDKELDLAAVTEHIQSLAPAAPPAADTDQASDDDEPTVQKLAQELEEVKKTLKKTTTEFEAFKSAAGANKSAPPMPPNDAPTNDGEPDKLLEFNKKLAEQAAQNG